MDTDDMADDQPCQELQTLNIFTPDVIDGVKDLYTPIFEKIRIYGSVDEPVFVAKDVQEALGLKDMNYSREGYFEWGIDKVKIKVKTAAGMRPTIAFTEQGLYRAIWHSKAEMAKQFQKFMTCVMKRLRQTGSVTMEQALADLKALQEKLEKSEKTVKAYDIQLDVEHKELMHYKAEHDELVMGHQNINLELWKARQRLEHARDPHAGELQDRLQRLMERTGRAIYVMLNDVPEVHKETYDYNIEHYSEWDEDITDPSEVMVWSVGLTALKTKVTIKKVYVHKSVKLDDIHAALHNYRLEKLDKKGEIAGHYTNMYTISLDQLDIIIDDVNRADEKTHQDE
jgi:prophage antirepressor-like protein